jgi:DNA end-binding protein Ku
MSRPIWKGTVSFGLVNVPITLYSLERRAGDVSFRLIDSRNTARVRYERVNEETGEEVPWDKIVKGYEYNDGNYVLFSEEELENASPEMSKTVEIEQFVDLGEIDVMYFDRPYLLVPAAKGEKGYVLLREALSESGKAGIARVVIRARQYLAALIAEGDALVLELLRFQQELRDLGEFELPTSDLGEYKVSKKEIQLAGQLIDGMTADWEPAQFKDEYRDALMKLIERKIASGQTEAIEDIEEEGAPAPQTINFMDMLKESVAKTSKRRAKQSGPGKKKPAARRRTSRKKHAG